MQMDAEFEKEQIGTLFVQGGQYLGGTLRAPAQKFDVTSTTFF